MRLFDRLRRKPSARDARILALLDEIEREMRRVGFWTDDPPEVEVSRYTEAPSFELWIQCVFLPNARDAARTGRYPEGSQVGRMARRQYDYHSFVEEAQPLLELLDRFDRLVEGE